MDNVEAPTPAWVVTRAASVIRAMVRATEPRAPGVPVGAMGDQFDAAARALAGLGMLREQRAEPYEVPPSTSPFATTDEARTCTCGRGPDVHEHAMGCPLDPYVFGCRFHTHKGRDPRQIPGEDGYPAGTRRPGIYAAPDPAQQLDPDCAARKCHACGSGARDCACPHHLCQTCDANFKAPASECTCPAWCGQIACRATGLVMTEERHPL